MWHYMHPSATVPPPRCTVLRLPSRSVYCVIIMLVTCPSINLLLLPNLFCSFRQPAPSLLGAMFDPISWMRDCFRLNTAVPAVLCVVAGLHPCCRMHPMCGSLCRASMFTKAVLCITIWGHLPTRHPTETVKCSLATDDSEQGRLFCSAGGPSPSCAPNATQCALLSHPCILTAAVIYLKPATIQGIAPCHRF